jgi:HD superfamily phosphodiesterase
MTSDIRSKLLSYLASDEILRSIYSYTLERHKAATNLTAHNGEHIYRDLINAVVIGEAEGANMHVVLCAMVLHDIGYLWGGSGRTHADLGAEHLDEFLAQGNIALPAAELEHIRDCIKTHKGGVHQLVPDTIEAKTVSDADILEKIGPVGVYQMLRSLTEFNEPAERVIERLDGADDRQLITATGQALARRRHGFAKQFAAHLRTAYEPYIQPPDQEEPS